jgi:hypothetical protein
MLRLLTPRWRSRAAAALASLICLGLAGCGSDDKNPGRPGTGGQNPPAAQFDQTMAVAQSQASAVQAVTLVESMATLAGGVGKTAGADAGKNYGWSEENQRWEYDYEYAAGGTTYNWFYWVQYLDDDGLPQQSSLGAASVNHNMTGIGHYLQQIESATITYDYTYFYGTTITGMGTGTLLLNGNGGYDFDYDYSSPSFNLAQAFAVTWEIQPPGISRDATGGCPTGTVRCEFPPYYSVVTFNGTGTATSTLYDASGNAVAGGGSVHTLACTTR